MGNGKNILDRFSLGGRTALVTGGAQGIGFGFARALCEAGARVAIVDINAEHAEDAAQKLISQGGQAMALCVDVTDETAVEQMIKTITEKWGRLTIAFNNAGIGAWEDAETQSRESWEKILNLNLNAVYFCCKHEGAHMLKNGYGKIVNTASMSGHIANTPQNQCAYNTSKAGVLHLTRSLAAEWAPKGVRVNSISPGYTRTQLVGDLLDTPVGKDMLPEWMRLTPMKKMIEIADLQGAAVYLAAEVSDSMTGADLLIDGGYCCW